MEVPSANTSRNSSARPGRVPACSPLRQGSTAESGWTSGSAQRCPLPPAGMPPTAPGSRRRGLPRVDAGRVSGLGRRGPADPMATQHQDDLPLVPPHRATLRYRGSPLLAVAAACPSRHLLLDLRRAGGGQRAARSRSHGAGRAEAHTAWVWCVAGEGHSPATNPVRTHGHAGCLAHVLHCMARQAAPSYAALCRQVRNSPLVSPDETGRCAGTVPTGCGPSPRRLYEGRRDSSRPRRRRRGHHPRCRLRRRARARRVGPYRGFTRRPGSYSGRGSCRLSFSRAWSNAGIGSAVRTCSSQNTPS